MNSTKILYHSNCADGIFAAYYAHLKFPDADCIPVRYQEPLPSLDGLEVVCVDYCPDRKYLETINPSSLFVIDHHVSKNIELMGLNEEWTTPFAPSYPFKYVYDANKCGAMLTWEYYNHPTYLKPWVLDYIQDRDLWQWKLPGSKEVDAFIQSLPFNFENCLMIERMYLNECVGEGEPIIRYQEKLIRQAVAQARETEFEGHKVMIVNSSVLQSEIGHELGKDRPFAIVWHNQDKSKRFVYSLRSVETGVDVSLIAKKFGGGGHVHAASFSLPWHMCERDASQQLDMIVDYLKSKNDLASILIMASGKCMYREGIGNSRYMSVQEFAKEIGS